MGILFNIYVFKEVVNEYMNLIIDDDLYRLDGISMDKHKVRLRY